MQLLCFKFKNLLLKTTKPPIKPNSVNKTPNAIEIITASVLGKFNNEKT